MTMKLLFLFGCLLVTVNAGTYGEQKTSLEDIERDYNSNERSSTYDQTTKTNSVSSPTKFGFVPQRTASSYAATAPKFQYTQTHYQLKKPTPKPQSAHYVTQYSQPKPQYASLPSQLYSSPEKYSLASPGLDYSQQYLTQPQAQDYTYVQPDISNQQYVIQYQQPGQQYDQYENIQYVADNSLAQPESKQYLSPQPQYYYVQQYQAPSTAIESVLDPKGAQYVIPSSYSGNSIPSDQKYQQQYTTSAEPQLPTMVKSVTRYTSVLPGKSSGSKYRSSPKNIQYAAPPQTQYQQQEEFVVKREPKSLLDSYVPSYLQLQYLRQQGKPGYSKY